MPSRRRIISVLLVTLAALSLAIPTACARDLGSVQTEVKVIGPYTIESGGLMELPSGPQEISFPEPVWVVGYRTEIRNPSGEVLRNDYHCHTQLKTYFSEEWSKRSRDGAPFKGVYSDGYTTELRVPEGFGVYFEAGEPIVLFPAFNNRDDQPLMAKMHIEIDYIPAKDVTSTIEPLYATVVSIGQPQLYWVDPGVDERIVDVRFQYPGRIHFMGVHIHPYGESIELYNKTTGKSVWKAVGERSPEGPLLNMPTYTSKEGYVFNPQEDYLMRVRYNNPTDRPQDAMAGLFILFASEDGQLPAPTGPAPETPATHHNH